MSYGEGFSPKELSTAVDFEVPVDNFVVEPLTARTVELPARRGDDGRGIMMASVGDPEACFAAFLRAGDPGFG